ncbi:MAG TPA: 30S ribosomal protein S9 [Thermomicrobiales bacterium]|jgi:small subunit ribosomal protein S9|nr:30S ribosomal protein S9 [Thermomicrobiales bacterium]
MSEQADSSRYFFGVGRRKTAVALVRLYRGTGNFTVNGRSAREHFGGRDALFTAMDSPLRLVNLQGQFDIVVKVVGGGTSGQAGAIRHGISRALLRVDDDLRSPLKRAKFLTRDPRAKERKKVGLKRARKAPQYTKR